MDPTESEVLREAWGFLQENVVVTDALLKYLQQKRVTKQFCTFAEIEKEISGMVSRLAFHPIDLVSSHNIQQFGVEPKMKVHSGFGFGLSKTCFGRDSAQN